MLSVASGKLSSWISRQILHYSSVGGYLEPVIQLVKPNWRDGYYRAEVVAVKKLQANTVEVLLKVPSYWPVHKAGQHLELTLEIAGRLITRLFTIASSPSLARSKRVVRLVVKSQPHGILTPRLETLALGNWVNISKPSGDFTLEPQTSLQTPIQNPLQAKALPQSKQSVVFLAAGSGITPFIAMLNNMLDDLPGSSKHKRGANVSTLHLVYYAKSGEHLLIDELEVIAEQLDFFTFELLTRTKDGELSKKLPTLNADALYVCGPSPFYHAAAEFSKRENLLIYAEHFSLIPTTPDEQQTFAAQLNGERIELTNAEPVLTQLLAKGRQLTYGCKMGICHQCQCVKKSGVVKNLRTGEVSDRGEELIQLCVSQLMTDVELEA